MDFLRHGLMVLHVIRRLLNLGDWSANNSDCEIHSRLYLLTDSSIGIGVGFKGGAMKRPVRLTVRVKWS